MSDTSTQPARRHQVKGAGVTVTVVALLLMGGWGGWGIRGSWDAKSSTATTTPTSLAAAHDTTTTTGK